MWLWDVQYYVEKKKSILVLKGHAGTIPTTVKPSLKDQYRTGLRAGGGGVAGLIPGSAYFSFLSLRQDSFLSRRGPVWTMLCGKAASGLEIILSTVLVKGLLESMVRGTGSCYIIEITMKTAFKHQTINQPNISFLLDASEMMRFREE